MQLPINEILETAILAPSVDNCQPWLFHVKDDSIEIYLDLKRAEFFGDTNYTASYVTLGAVIENIIIASNHCGYHASVTHFPSPGNNLIACIKLSEGYKEKPSLYGYLSLRCTNRRIFKKSTIPTNILESIRNGVKDIVGANVSLINDRETIKKIACLVKKNDRVIFEHRFLHEGLFRWIRWDEDELDKTRDGLPITSLELNKPQQKAFKLISSWKTIDFLNKFGISKIISGYSYRLVKSASAVGLITMDNNSPEDYINGGRAFERIWLIATSGGLAFQPFGGIVFLTTKLRLYGGEGFSLKQQKSLEEIYSSLCNIFPIKNNNALIILFRIGYAEPPSQRTLRRPLNEVIKSF
jgi:hypothetical protein